MMNRSKIDWCDFSWNPISGCLYDCPYCYANKQAKRFCGDVRLNKNSHQLQHESNLWILEKPFYNINNKVIPMPVGFEPTLHLYRLTMPQEKKLPSNIFVGSMADIFGEWVPDEWIKLVLDACESAPWHRYLFLTKNPQRYNDLLDSGILIPKSNYWFGITRTGKDSEREQITVNHGNTFLSIEPLLAPLPVNTLNTIKLWRWVIIGAESGNRRNKIIPEREWIESIVEACKADNIPVFMKSSIKELMGEKFIQEYP